jgi:hypothetical protein
LKFEELKFRKYGKNLPDVLELENEIPSVEVALKSQLKRLNYLLGIVNEKKPNSYLDYVNNLKLKFESLVKKDYLKNRNININDLLTDFNNLNNLPELAKYYMNFMMQILGVSETTDLSNEKIKITKRIYLRTLLVPRYYNALVLTETINRDVAIQLYKFFVTRLVIENQSPSRKIFDSLEAFQDFFEKDKKEVTIGVYGVLSDVTNGKFFFRKDNCLYADAIADLPDKIVKYLVCCYVDFQAAVARSHGNFILTMEHTIVEGDPYCDCIIHDTNIDWDLKHPSKEFWDNIKPEK